MENNSTQFNEEQEESINIRDIISQYTFHWTWFVLSVVLLLGAAFLYLRYTERIYSSKGTILIKDDKKGGSMSEMAVFSDLDLFGSSGNLENEIEILKSRKLASTVAKKLQLNKKYIIKGSVTGFHAHEYFENSPIKINHSINDSLLYTSGGSFELTIIDNQSYNLSETDGKNFGKKN